MAGIKNREADYVSNINDKNYISYDQMKGVVVDRNSFHQTERPVGFASIIKCSRCENIEVTGITITSCVGDCTGIHVARGRNLVISECTMQPGGLGVIEIQGAFDGAVIQDVAFAGHGYGYDIRLGYFDNHWHPFWSPTGPTIIRRVSAYNDAPVRIEVWDATNPIVHDSNVEVVKIPWIVWFPCFCWRAIVVRLGGKKTS